MGWLNPVTLRLAGATVNGSSCQCIWRCAQAQEQPGERRGVDIYRDFRESVPTALQNRTPQSPYVCF